jgi:2-oxoglutarate ferredoxin oxidoreductase subunit gamma
VKPGGTLIYDPYGIHRPPSRADINIHRVDAMEATFTMANAKSFNMIVLGALLKIKPLVPIDSVIKGLKKTLPERHHHLIPLNEEALRRGMSLVD